MLKLQEVLDASGFTPAEVSQMKNKRAVVKGVLESTNKRELAARIGFVISSDAASMKELEEIFISSSKRMDGDATVKQMGTLTDDPDFSSLTLEPHGKAMTKMYLSAKAGGPDNLNLSQKEIDSFNALHKGASQAQVEEKLREILVARYKEYRESGLKGISLYARGRGKNYSPGEELELKTKKAELLQKSCPAFHSYLLGYPHADKPEGLEDSFSWVNFTIDDKPTIALVHKACMTVGNVFVFCQRHFYVSRGHNSMQGTGGAFPDGKQTAVVYGSRTSTDQVTGFGGNTKRAMGARIMGGRIADNMEHIRKSIET